LYALWGSEPRLQVISEVNAMGSPAEVLQHILETVVPVQNTHFHNPLAVG
jgi:hypothetical protein